MSWEYGTLKVESENSFDMNSGLHAKRHHLLICNQCDRIEKKVPVLELPSLLHISDEISLKSLNVAKTQK